MNLYDLENTNKFSKLHTVLNDVFETNFNFNMPKAKLEAVATATDQKRERNGRIQQGYAKTTSYCTRS